MVLGSVGDCCSYSCLHVAGLLQCLHSASASPCHTDLVSSGSLKPFIHTLRVMTAGGQLITHFRAVAALQLQGQGSAPSAVCQRGWHRGSRCQHSAIPAMPWPHLQGWRSQGIQISPTPLCELKSAPSSCSPPSNLFCYASPIGASAPVPFRVSGS